MIRKRKKPPIASYEQRTMDRAPRGVSYWILTGHVIEYGKMEKLEDKR